MGPNEFKNVEKEYAMGMARQEFVKTEKKRSEKHLPPNIKNVERCQKMLQEMKKGGVYNLKDKFIKELALREERE